MPDPASQDPQAAVPQVPLVPQPSNVVHDILAADAAPVAQDNADHPVVISFNFLSSMRACLVALALVAF